MLIHGNLRPHFPPPPFSAVRLHNSHSSPLCFSFSSAASQFFSSNRTFSFRIPNTKPSPSRSFFFRPRAAAGKDHYSTLQISRSASLKEIKAAYRNLARKYHPDMNKSPGAEEKFKEISAAYEVLSDDEKRSLYDRFGEAGLEGEYGNSDGGSFGVDPFEVFETFFGGSNGFFGGEEELEGFSFMGNGRSKSLDIRHDLYLKFEESVFGGKREIEISCFEACEQCDGTGAKSSSCIQDCHSCGGTGGATKTTKTPFGVMSQVSTCGKCGGDGKIITENCRTCGGKGKVKSKQTIEVDIPAGVSDGSTMRFEGDGNIDMRSGSVGDLYIVLHVDEKEGFERDGLNLYSKINVFYTDAILGTSIKVETVEGMRDLKIPAGIQPGETVKLSRMGIPSMNIPFSRGDHHFIINVVIPKKISDVERALLEELASFKNSRQGFYTTSERSGTPSESSTKRQARGETTSSSKQEEKRSKSLWSSIKNFIGRRQSKEGFAVISVNMPALLQRSTMPSSPFLVSLFAVFILTCICTLTGKTSDPKSLQRDSSHTRRTLKEKQ